MPYHAMPYHAIPCHTKPQSPYLTTFTIPHFRTTASPPLCHAAGGAAYVLSAAAVAALARVGSQPLPPLFHRIDNVSYGALRPRTHAPSPPTDTHGCDTGGEDVTVAYALKEATGAAAAG